MEFFEMNVIMPAVFYNFLLIYNIICLFAISFLVICWCDNARSSA